MRYERTSSKKLQSSKLNIRDMDKKNITLATFAFCLALGSAYASSTLVLKDVFVKNHPRSNPMATVCTNTGVQCDDAGSSLCTVEIPVIGGTQIIQSNTSFKPYSASNCTNEILHHSTSATLVSSVMTVGSVISD